MPDDALAKLLQSCETNNDTEIQDAALNIINQGYAADIVVYQVGRQCSLSWEQYNLMLYHSSCTMRL